MKKYYLALALLTMVGTAHAANQRMFRDLKLPTQQMVEKQSFDNVAAFSTASILSANAGNTSAAAATVSTFLAQPDVARNLVITPGGATGDVASCVVVANGTDIRGQALFENFTFPANHSTAVYGTKAFQTVTSVVFPAACEDSAFGATWSIGVGESLGVKHCMAKAGHVVQSLLNGVKEATGPSMVVSATSVPATTVNFDGAYNGTNDFELFYFQNYCQ